VEEEESLSSFGFGNSNEFAKRFIAFRGQVFFFFFFLVLLSRVLDRWRNPAEFLKKNIEKKTFEISEYLSFPFAKDS
jgi:hypothetical protein